MYVECLAQRKISTSWLMKIYLDILPKKHLYNNIAYYKIIMYFDGEIFWLEETQTQGSSYIIKQHIRLFSVDQYVLKNSYAKPKMIIWRKKSTFALISWRVTTLSVSLWAFSLTLCLSGQSRETNKYVSLGLGTQLWYFNIHLISPFITSLHEFLVKVWNVICIFFFSLIQK